MSDDNFTKNQLNGSHMAYNIFINTCDKYNFMWRDIVLNYKNKLSDIHQQYTIYINNEIYIDEKLREEFPNVVFLSEIRGPKMYPMSQWTQHVNSAMNVLLKEKIYNIIYVQDDYFITNDVSNDYLTAIMEEYIDENIDCLHLSSFTKSYSKISHRLSPYFFNTQIAIWNVRTLSKITTRRMDAWNWELFGQLTYLFKIKVKLSKFSDQLNYIAVITDGGYLHDVLPLLPQRLKLSLTNNLNRYNKRKYERLNTIKKVIRHWLGRK